MKKMIEYLNKVLNRYRFFLYEMVSIQDYRSMIQHLEGFIAEVNTFLDECKNEEDKTTLLQIKQTAESYRERAKGLQEIYCIKKQEDEILPC